ncbi:hypothetical protein ACI77O_11915 [Pseudomonas tritici]|uniref:hypothetical protein n=1 Tax=Pseudomonas tritici TaxID=2745518 RepID=UPI00387B6F7D
MNITTLTTSSGEEALVQFCSGAGTGKGKTILPQSERGSVQGADCLKAYQVGDFDIVAAYTPAGAIDVLCGQSGMPRDDYVLNDVSLVGDKKLDSLEIFNQDEGKTETLKTSLRQDVAALAAPAYIYGWD